MSNVQNQPTGNSMVCPGCGKWVEGDIIKYGEHVGSDHKMHLIEIKGVGPQYVPYPGQQLPGQPRPRSPPRILDIPYIGRVTANGFIIWSLFMLIIGVLMGARII